MQEHVKLNINNHERELIYNLTCNSRFKKNEIANKLRISPQLLNYTYGKVVEKKLITGFDTYIDPARFGLTEVIVLYNFIINNTEEIHQILRDLISDDEITYVQRLVLGADIYVKYTVPNLSHFHKKHMFFLAKYQEQVETMGVYPLIVNHAFSFDFLLEGKKKTESTKYGNYIKKEYLPARNEIIMSGDREKLELSSNEKKVLKILISDSSLPAINIAKKTDLDARTVIHIISDLQKKEVIKKFSVRISQRKLKVHSCKLFINTKGMPINLSQQVISFAKKCPQIVSVIKLIGHYALLVNIKSLSSYVTIIENMRKEVHFSNYVVYSSKEVLKKQFIPLSVLE